MRLTNSTLLRGYNRDLQRLKTEKNACEKRITSTRKFSRASDAPLSAAKALNVRKSQYYSAQYKENLKVASKFYTEAETSLLQVSEKMAEIRETIIAACNTTKDNVDYNIYAQQLETMAKELCAIFNTDSAGRAIFGGESDNSQPFTIINDSNGNAATVLYHGVPVNAMNDFMGFPFTNPVYMDIGLGMVTDQLTHAQDPMSVLDISFNGAKITGCGAEYGIADIDLTSIKENRNYVIDVYADGVKKTISFRGKGTQQENVAQINQLLAEAYKKEGKAGKNVPTMDDQGMIYLVDKDGKAVDNGIVCVVNNTTLSDSSRAEKLVVDNDSNYTNKYRVMVDSLPQNTTFSMDVEVDGVRKGISFATGVDDFSDPLNPVYAEDITIQNLQKALDDVFGPGKVNVTDHAPNKGVISSEGSNVKLWGNTMAPEGGKPGAYSANFATVDYEALVEGETYTVKAMINGVLYETEFVAGATPAENHSRLDRALEKAGSSTSHRCNDQTGVSTCGDVAVDFIYAGGDNPLPLKNEYTTSGIDVASFLPGSTYEYEITIDGRTETVSITGGQTPQETVANMRDAIRAAFGDSTTSPNIYVSGKGDIVTYDGKAVDVKRDSAGSSTEEPFERERIYSKNYIQLTLDAARALRNGDIEYANGCIDRIVTASEALLAQIADIGCNEDFVDFNVERLTTREENLAERQNELEISNPEYEITLWKTFEAYYNACLQMSSSVIPNSIFNYMK